MQRCMLLVQNTIVRERVPHAIPVSRVACSPPTTWLFLEVLEEMSTLICEKEMVAIVVYSVRYWKDPVLYIHN